MKKLLTIIIPTYNMEAYLDKCLVSILVGTESFHQQLECLIIIDGATDCSSQIAHRYESNYPNVVRVVDKENGNYGSCVNRGLQEARGEYVKVIDADDWIDTNSFSLYLKALVSINVDLVITDFQKVDSHGNILYASNYRPLRQGILQAEDLVAQPCMQMHALTYRTQMLREHNYWQTTGISYTDTEWAVIPMLYVKQFTYLPFNVYCYLSGREGQTMDSSVIIKRCSNFVKTFTKIIEWFKNENIGNIENTYSYKKLHESVVFLYYTILLESCLKHCDELKQFDLWLKEEFPILYNHLNKATDNNSSKFRYVRYWRNHHYAIQRPLFNIIKWKIISKIINMKRRICSYTMHSIVFCAIFTILICICWGCNNKSGNTILNLPDSTGVVIDSTNLPIVLINTNGLIIEKEKWQPVELVIIDNGDKKWNYLDTVRYSNQLICKGEFLLKYRGHSSFNESPKKSYGVRPIEGGGKIKKSLLGMGASKKWALLAPLSDRSLIRDLLTLELARPFFDFTPKAKFCELVVDGVYRGVYILAEQVSADRLKINKSEGFLLEIDDRKKESYKSQIFHNKYILESPKKSKITLERFNRITACIDSMEYNIANTSYSQWSKIIDVKSFIDYQLIQEFSSNPDAYKFSTFLYDNGEDNGRIKCAIWDFNIAYGNCNFQTDELRQQVYENGNNLWAHLMRDSIYCNMLKLRWVEYRSYVFTISHIESKIDSLVNILKISGAEKRNSSAWEIWSKDWKGPKYYWPNKYLSSTYDDEILYLKRWIKQRTKWLDEVLAIKISE